MELKIERKILTDNCTIGKLYIDNKYFCDTLEDKVRDSNKSGQFDGSEKKIHGQTAIPYGTYKVVMNIVSPKFKDRPWAKPYGGKLPRLLNVPSFDGVLIHVGNTVKDTLGCILVGKHNGGETISQSTYTFNQLMSILTKTKESISITIV